MKWGLFFLISALVHAVFLALPFQDLPEGGGEAIPVTLIVEQTQPAEARTDLPVTGVKTIPGRKAPLEKARAGEIRQAPARRPMQTLEAKLRTPRRPEAVRRPGGEPVMKKPIGKRILESASQIGAPVVANLSNPTTRQVASAPSPEPVGAWRSEESDEIFTLLGVPVSLDEKPVARDRVPRPLQGQTDVKAAAKTKDSHTEALTTKSVITSAKKTQGKNSKPPLLSRASYARIAKPEYPARARQRGWEGTTLLRVLVDRQGISASIEVIGSSGFEILDQAAVRTVRGWRFHPARSAAGPVESWVKIPIVFSLVKRDRGW